MTRVIWIQLGVDPSNSDVYTVKCFYRYSYEGADFDSVLNDTKIEKSKLENIYLFYNITKDTGAEEVKVDCDPSILATEAEKVNVYMICQNGSHQWLFPQYICNRDSPADELLYQWNQLYRYHGKDRFH